MPKPHAAQRVLVYRLGSLGDTVIALPALKLIAEAFPQAERRLLTSFPPNAKAPPSSAIVEHTGLIHGYLRYTYSTRSPRELIALWWQIVKWRPQVMVYLNGKRSVASAWRDAVFFRLCGIGRLIGMPVSDDMQDNRELLESPARPMGVEGTILEHESARLLRNISELGALDLEDPHTWDLSLTAAEIQRASEVLTPAAGFRLIAISLGTKNQSNDWELHNWRALLAVLGERYSDCALVICGAPVEFDASEKVAEGWRKHSSNPVINLCGALQPRETAAVFQRSQVFIGHDSGPSHLAAAVQTPCVGIYGARHFPGMWFPYGSRNYVLYHRVECAGCELNTCIAQRKKCVLSITVDEVLTAIACILKSNRPVHIQNLRTDASKSFPNKATSAGSN